ncbi:MAG: hypothetical protein LBI28_09420 [Treponema sp.]|jgi:hypothetical protein|nr:hypothetical protein [Treponema sp.]
MKKLVIVLIILLAASAAYADTINLGDFPVGAWIDSNYDAVWEFTSTNIRILSTSGAVLWDFRGKTIQNFSVSLDGAQPVISFSCPEAGRSYRFAKSLTNSNLTMQIERSGLAAYSVNMRSR